MRRRSDPEYPRDLPTRRADLAEPAARSSRLFELSEAGKASLPVFEQLIDRQLVEFVKILQQCVANDFACLCRLAVCSTQRFSQYFVNQSEAVEAIGGNTHGFGGILRFFGTLPQNRGTALR